MNTKDIHHRQNVHRQYADLSVVVLNRGLRLFDNAALHAAAQYRNMICVYLMDEASPCRPGGVNIGQWSQPPSKLRQTYLAHVLSYFDRQLRKYGQSLWLLSGDPEYSFSNLLEKLPVTNVYGIEPAGINELSSWSRLDLYYPEVKFEWYQKHSIFTEQQLPFELDKLPVTFTAFRKLVEEVNVSRAQNVPAQLPPSPFCHVTDMTCIGARTASEFSVQNKSVSLEGLIMPDDWAPHIHAYMDSDHPSSYKLTRDSLDGEFKSSGWSIPLSYGLVSVRHLIELIRAYEDQKECNSSTYWLWFELLWREYFFWYSRKWGRSLFRQSGIHDGYRMGTFHSQRFQAWCQGNTPYALVNACMRELKTTGMLSNRGRQVVASCLINELEVDWRYGAAWFEQNLLDYEVGSNWGNWQYIAGVGADPRGGRHFDIEKQRQLYDKEGMYVQAWHGEERMMSMHNVDYSGWPLTDR